MERSRGGGMETSGAPRSRPFHHVACRPRRRSARLDGTNSLPRPVVPEEGAHASKPGFRIIREVPFLRCPHVVSPSIERTGRFDPCSRSCWRRLSSERRARAWLSPASRGHARWSARVRATTKQRSPGSERTCSWHWALSATLVAATVAMGGSQDGIARVAQGTAAGIGFIGTGATLKTTEREHVQGLTTAASIWMTSAIGVAAGMGSVDCRRCCAGRLVHSPGSGSGGTSSAQAR